MDFDYNSVLLSVLLLKANSQIMLFNRGAGNKFGCCLLLGYLTVPSKFNFIVD